MLNFWSKKGTYRQREQLWNSSFTKYYWCWQTEEPLWWGAVAHLPVQHSVRGAEEGLQWWFSLQGIYSLRKLFSLSFLLPIVVWRPTHHQALGSPLHLSPGEESSGQLHPCVLPLPGPGWTRENQQQAQTSLNFLFRGELWLQEEQAEHRAEIR